MKTIKIAIITGLICNGFAFADGPEPSPSVQELQAELLRTFDNSADEAQAEAKRTTLDTLSVPSNQSAPKNTLVQAPAFLDMKAEVKEEKKDVDESAELIDSLVDQVETLKTKAIETKRIILSTENPRQQVKVGSKTIYSYLDGQLYEVHAGVERVTDVILQPGEKLTEVPVAGDKARWKLDLLVSGTGDQERTHVLLKPLLPSLETNLILATNKRTYHLRIQSGDWYMPTIEWTYPDDEAKLLESKLLAQKQVEESAEPVLGAPENLRFDYAVEGRNYEWRPIRVFDDGRKTYLQMPTGMAVGEAPALFVITEDDEVALTNYRVKGQYYIVDRLFERAQLRIGTKAQVDIYGPNYKPSFFERIF